MTQIVEFIEFYNFEIYYVIYIWSWIVVMKIMQNVRFKNAFVNYSSRNLQRTISYWKLKVLLDEWSQGPALPSKLRKPDKWATGGPQPPLQGIYENVAP